MPIEPRFIGFTAGSRGAPVSVRARTDFRSTVHRTLPPGFILPTSCRLFRAPSLLAPPDPVRAEPPARVLGPRHDITGARPLPRGIPAPHYVPSTGDHSLSTVCSALRLRGLLHPRAMFRACSRSGGCRARAAGPARRRTDAPLPLDTLVLVKISRSSRPDERASTSRLCSTRELRACRLGDEPDQPPRPSPGSLSSGSTTARPSPGLPGTIRS
jgi:hypothetical protein